MTTDNDALLFREEFIEYPRFGFASVARSGAQAESVAQPQIMGGIDFARRVTLAGGLGRRVDFDADLLFAAEGMSAKPGSSTTVRPWPPCSVVLCSPLGYEAGRADCYGPASSRPEMV